MKNLIGLSLILIFLSGCSHFQQCETPMNPLLGGFYGEGHAARSSSYDRTGANADSIQILPNKTATLADIKGQVDEPLLQIPGGERCDIDEGVSLVRIQIGDLPDVPLENGGAIDFSRLQV